MAKEIRQKETFGTVAFDRITPPAFLENAPKAVNIVLSFEEALKLYFGIGQCLAKLNSYNRSTTAGKNAAVNLCLFNNKERTSRISINEDQTRRPKAKPAATTNGEADTE